MKLKVAIILALMALVGVGHAQKIKGFAAAVKLGYLGAPGSATAFSAVSSHGVSGFSNNYLAFGAGGYYRTGNVLVGLEGIWGSQKARSSGTDQSKPLVGAMHARFGYIVNKNSDTHWIYPSIGMGSSFAMLTYSGKNLDGTTHYGIDRMLMSPSIDFGMNADFLINKVSAEKTKYGAFILGVRAGYYASISSSSWRNSNWDVVGNSPSYANNAFYVTCTIGGGWFMKKI